MKNLKAPLPVWLLLSIGLLLATMPLLMKNYITISDLSWGLLTGIGLAMELTSLVLLKRMKKTSGCS